jgi:saccharopine dehydrogenase (NAD+, L-lysine-forming)
MVKNIIYIRRETIDNEYRTPLIPNDIKILINNGFIIYVQSCINRIYEDDVYKNSGAIITSENWYESKFNNAIIIGIKELDNLEKLNNNTHIYFSHSFKNQINSEYILKNFINSNSQLYDFEYFLENNKRLIAFGYYSGLVGAILGLKQYFNKLLKSNILDNVILNLKPWDSFDDIYNYVKDDIKKNISIAIIGSNGRCGSGVRLILDKFNLEYTSIDRNGDISNLKKFDIIYNCILLDEKYDKVWFDNKTVFNKDLVIVDISCDYSKINNPIKLYNFSTSWKLPVFIYNKYIDIIAIDNLPSLLPKESSDYFSKKLTELLLQFNEDPNNYWKNTLNIYYNKANKYKN